LEQATTAERKDGSMREALISILCCPVCRGSLTIRMDDVTGSGGPEGTLRCEKCQVEYSIHKGLPRLYLSDDEIIERSDQSKHSEFIIDRKRLESLAEKVGKGSAERRREIFCIQRVSVLAILGWMFIALGCILLIVGSLTSRVNAAYWVSVWTVMLLSCIVFLVDFRLYRTSLNARYNHQVHKLAELSKASALSEYDLHPHGQNDDQEEDFDPLDKAKSEEIAQRLGRYKTNGKNGLNVGCGGGLHQLVSRPFFDCGYEMVGVDIREKYLMEYRNLFKADAVQANAMALPFRSDTFNVVNYCDILEHLHHPFLGLQEINRVLKNGGLAILSTNCRCRINRQCANPLILIERVVSLYYDDVLGPRDMLRGFDGMEFYHLDFSKREITELLESSGFEILEFYTYLTKRKMLTKLFSGLPILRFMGDAILVSCRKRDESVSNRN
jgi:ubiquinone/menaquinone biosynthesis C-methylase UbiE/uncharacterized protein YbaR (Trm112 family)